MTTSDTRLAALLLTNRLTRVDAAPLRAREFWALVERADAAGIALGSLLGDADLGAVATAEADTTRLRTLLGATRAIAFEIERLGEGGIAVVSALDAEFPGLLRDRLQHGCPPFLFVAGPHGWLTENGLAIIADDEPADAAATITATAAAAAVAAEWTLITSSIRGAAGDEAIACEGRIVLVTSDGINRAARDPAVRKLVQRGRLCIVSPYAPDATSSPAAARARDVIVHALAHTTLVTAARDGIGAAWSAATDAVGRDPASVAAWLGEGSADGNSALVSLGARPVATRQDLYALFETPAP